MKLTRDLTSEKYDAMLGVFEPTLPPNHFEIIIRGELSYPPIPENNRWTTGGCFKNDAETAHFVKDLLNVNIDYVKPEELEKCYLEIDNKIKAFINDYCEKYYMLPYDFSLGFETEDPITMEQKTGSDKYYPITQPFQIFITYNDNGKHYRVTKEDLK